MQTLFCLFKLTNCSVAILMQCRCTILECSVHKMPLSVYCVFFQNHKSTTLCSSIFGRPFHSKCISNVTSKGYSLLVENS